MEPVTPASCMPLNSPSDSANQIPAINREAPVISLSAMPRTNHCSLIVILLKSMACFFRCFGVRSADRRHVVSSSDSPITTPVEPVASMNQKASSLSPSEETEAVAEFDDWELRDETPDEIRKLPKKLKDSAGEDAEYKYHSWLPNISNSSLLENYNLSGQLPAPIRFDEENTTEPAAMDSPTACRITNEQSDVRISISSLEDVSDNTAVTANLEIDVTPDATYMSVSPAPAACKSEFLTRSVRFASESYPSENSPRTCIQHREKTELKEHGSIIKHSPYPTPLHLTHDMQTPGTVYASGNSARVRAQYVYTTMNSSEITDHSSISQGASLDSTQNANCNSDMSLSGSSIKGDVTVGTDLCSGIKTPAFDGAGNERKYKPGGNHGDRPILGLVAEHWKEEDVSQISPKEWDGNGIPNTTTKYKEDQKVHWHATPFEERLEKALSEETFIPRRKPAIMEAVVFEDDEERDTATCKLQSLKPSKPLASY